jgi:inner membrane protein
MDTILEYIAQNPMAMWVTVGGLFLVVEGLIMGFATGAFLFMGIGAWATALLLYVGMDLSWQQQILAFALSTAISVLSLWKIFKSMHNKNTTQDNSSSDMIGMELTMKTAVSTGEPGTISWSGINWQVTLDPSVTPDTTLAAGSYVEVTRVAVGKLTVKPKPV